MQPTNEYHLALDLLILRNTLFCILGTDVPYSKLYNKYLNNEFSQGELNFFIGLTKDAYI